MLQTEVICCRSPDRNFLLEKSDWSLIASEIRLKFIWCRSLSEDCSLERSGCIRNLIEGQPIAKFGRRYRRLTDRRVRKALWKFVRWRSLEDIVEGRPLEGFGGNLSVGGV